MGEEIGVGIIVGYLIKEIANGALKEVGKEYIFKPVINLLTPDELTSLNLLGDVPDSANLQEKVVNILETRLNENPQVANQLAEIIESFSNKSNIINKEITGESEIENIVEQFSNSTVNNDSSIVNRRIDSSKIKTSIKQSSK